VGMVVDGVYWEQDTGPGEGVGVRLGVGVGVGVAARVNVMELKSNGAVSSTTLSVCVPWVRVMVGPVMFACVSHPPVEGMETEPVTFVPSTSRCSDAFAVL
jgi:hypothetical protein